MSDQDFENGIGPSPQERHPSLELVGRQVQKGDQTFTITDVLLGPHYKPFKSGGTYHGAVVYENDETEEAFYGVVNDFAPPRRNRGRF